MAPRFEWIVAAGRSGTKQIDLAGHPFARSHIHPVRPSTGLVVLVESAERVISISPYKSAQWRHARSADRRGAGASWKQIATER